MQIDKKIKYLRENVYRITQEQLAKEIGLSRSSINNWESNLSIPSLQQISLLAIYFNVSIDYFIFSDKIKEELSLNKLTLDQSETITKVIESLL